MQATLTRDEVKVGWGQVKGRKDTVVVVVVVVVEVGSRRQGRSR